MHTPPTTTSIACPCSESAKQTRIAIAVLLIAVLKDDMAQSLARSWGGPLGHNIEGTYPLY